MSGTGRKADFDLPLKACRLCGSGDISSYYYDFAGRTISRCSSCNVQFLNPQYSNAHLKRYYSSYSKEAPEWDEPLNYCHHYYLSLLEKHRTPGRLLDIGSGEGHLLKAARQRGWHADGYEVDSKLARRTAKKLGLKVHHGALARLPLTKSSFDAVAMHNVLEHVKNPSEYINKTRSLLLPGGLFFLVLPNIRSRSATVKFLLERLGFRRKRVASYYDADHHLWFFTPGVLRRELERNGFNILEARSGHAARPRQSALKRLWMRNIGDLPLWKSTFLLIARKP